MEDVVALSFLAGNDFLPTLPCVEAGKRPPSEWERLTAAGDGVSLGELAQARRAESLTCPGHAAEGRPPPVDGWEGDAGKRLRGRVAADFLEGVAWTLRYYYEGPVGHHGWAWFYRWPCAPLAVDLARAMPRPLPRRVGAALPCVTPLEQLGMVLPQPSMHALPSPLRQLPEMLPLAFPDADACRLGVDYDGKRFRWQGTLALPFVEAEQLRTLYEAFRPALQPHETARDEVTPATLYVRPELAAALSAVSPPHPGLDVLAAGGLLHARVDVSGLASQFPTSWGEAPPRCRFFLAGKCAKGSACPFLHEKGAARLEERRQRPETRAVCRDLPAALEALALCATSDGAGEGGREGRGAVLIMRGLPGSGKSSVSRAVTELLAAEGGAVACSADHFFERGGVLSEAELAGLGACERYRAAFRTDLLGEAHAQCRAAFDAALAGGVPLVVVDNTHSRRGEYDYYRAAAKERGYRLAVLELRCASTAEARSFHARCSHGVPWAVYESMLRRWEADEGAVLLAASPSVA
ncbi:hypothetical protein EMIHUDRAFT_447930, partial [Emiliania huxleyi CCMP1516]|uniref:C3H1-type domain-containing protein n=2 Tax=Emiliania huxleyi TaxID=2903 RepID=A0A0D3J3I9_EMIH1